MKRVILGLFIGLIVGSVVAWSFLKRHEAGEKHEAAKEEHKDESHLVHGTNGETYLKFDKEAQTKMGLKVAELTSAELAPEIRVTGRVLDATALATSLNDIALARAQMEASQRELDRTKLLFGQNQNVSARALEVAQATVERDRIALQAAQLRLASTWGPAIAGMKEIDSFARAALELKAALVRLDVPVGQTLKGAPIGGRIAALTAPDRSISAKLLGAATSVDPQSQSAGFLFIVETNGFGPGAPVLGWLALSGETEHGVIIPREAILRHEGESFIYVQRTDETFERKEVELEHPLENGWFTDELKPPLKVVVAGAQQLLSEEFKGEAE